LLVFAARREHIAQVITPTLARGAWVLSDRFTDATYAYQGGGRGVALEKLALLERWVHADLEPDLTLIFDVPPEIAQARYRGDRGASDRFEAEQIAFFGAVREAYLRRARENTRRIRVVDASLSIAEIQAKLREIVPLG
jgi:dTMP kinase